MRRRKLFCVNGCPMCLKEEETTHYLLIHCQYAYKVWMALLNFFDMNWVMPKNVDDLFFQHVYEVSLLTAIFCGN